MTLAGKFLNEAYKADPEMPLLSEYLTQVKDRVDSE